MEFTVNVNLNASPELVEVVNRLADAFGGTKPVVLEARTEEVKVITEIEKEPEIVEEVKEVIEEAPKATRTRKPAAPKVEEAPAEKIKTEVAEETAAPETDFVPEKETLRSLAIPLAQNGVDVKGELTRLGYAGIGQLYEGNVAADIKAMYAWLLNQKKA